MLVHFGSLANAMLWMREYVQNNVHYEVVDSIALSVVMSNDQLQFRLKFDYDDEVRQSHLHGVAGSAIADAAKIKAALDGACQEVNNYILSREEV